MIKLVNMVRAIDNLGARDKATLYALASYANTHKKYSSKPCSFPSQATLMKASGNSKNSITRSLSDLSELGLIDVLKYARKTDSGATHVYVFNLEAFPSEGKPQRGAFPSESVGFPQRECRLSPEGGTNSKNSKNRNIMPKNDSLKAEELELETESQSEEIKPEEEIYKAYPRKVAKTNALKAIKRALKSNSKEYLLEKVNLYTKKVENQEMKFIPHPATWFNGERYNDEVEAVNQPEKTLEDYYRDPNTF